MAKRKPLLDICRFRTDRIREMSLAQVRRARFQLSRTGQTKSRILRRTRFREADRAALEAFIDAVSLEKHAEDKKRRGIYGREFSPILRTAEADIADKRVMADGFERKIWDLQQQRGCKINPEEAVARDAVREGREQSLIDRLRGKRRPKIR